MASRICKFVFSWTCNPSAITFQRQNDLLPYSLKRKISSSEVGKKEGLLKRIKKYTFGEEPPPRQRDVDVEESYYELSKSLEPNVYSMEDEEIYDKLKQIVMETIPEAGNDWESKTVDDVTVKFQLLSKCHREFELLVPNNKLGSISSVQDIFNFYKNAVPEDKRTFKSIDMDNLPPNLIIGGKVPRKEISKMTY